MRYVGKVRSAEVPGEHSALALRVRPGEVLRRSFHPPLGDPPFWVIQGAIGGLTAVHMVLDASGAFRGAAGLTTLPVAALVVPVGYAALRYGLHGSAATALWATLLWLPVLGLHPLASDRGDELVCLVLVDAVGIFVGQRVERQALLEEAAGRARSSQQQSEARYRQLFAATRAPILILDAAGRIEDANPAAWAVFGREVLDTQASELLGVASGELMAGGRSGRLQIDVDGRPAEFRYLTTALADAGDAAVQVLLQDVTAERRAWRDARQYADLLIQVQERERARLAREIHDDPLQQLVHLARLLELGPIGKAPLDVCAARLETARDAALDAARRLRDISRGLRPPALDQLGLVAALQGLVVETEDAAGIDVELVVTGREQRLAVEAELGLFRIAQEALNNALTHGEAGRITIEIAYEGSTVRVRVTDDGAGFDTGSEPVPTRLGLRGMRERASLLGGRVQVKSAPGQGTVVTAVVPVLGIVSERTAEDES